LESFFSAVSPSGGESAAPSISTHRVFALPEETVQSAEKFSTTAYSFA